VWCNRGNILQARYPETDNNPEEGSGSGDASLTPNDDDDE